MRRALSYSDAVKILGGDTRLPVLIGQASVAGLIAAGGFNFVEAAREIVAIGTDLTNELGARLRGLDRLTRTDRLTAAHTVIVITAYFEQFAASLDRIGLERVVRLTGDEQLTLAFRERVDTNWRRLSGLLATGSDTPVLAPSTTRQGVQSLLRHDYYPRLGERVLQFLSGFTAWDELTDASRKRISVLVREELPQAAWLRYEELFRQLAAQCREFEIWVGLTEHASTRAQVCSGLSALESLLTNLTDGRLPERRRATLARAHAVALDRPLTVGTDLGGGLRLPSLGRGYIDHRFRMAELDLAAQPAVESWWEGFPVLDAIDRVLAAHLTSRAAQEAPLLVLGQPGSGKSVLTRVLAGRLPASDFMTVRVELRQVPAELDLQSQIELAVREATGESLSWPRLVESADGALPVVILDGFDELLQATGAHQTDFLLKVAAFQQREADQGRPVAVIVTSRIAVADRATPPPGTTALLLEPFGDDQITVWLERWREANETVFAQGLEPLPAPVALRHRDLARQPLLLLMLALYDASANALQRMSGELSGVELYERLLRDFTRREVGKTLEGSTDAELDRASESELRRLSIVAFAMFNRGSQWVTEAQLDADLAALLDERVDVQRRGGLRTPLTGAQALVGRFFFVHASRATSDGHALHTYEFLHATFGEFLVARLVAQILAETAQRGSSRGFALSGTADDGRLYALLSFSVLADSTPIVLFLKEMMREGRSVEWRAGTKQALLGLYGQALKARTETTYAGYEPRPSLVAERCAAWSANLVLLATIVADEVLGSELFPESSQSIAFAWRRQAMLWRSQLSPSWTSLVKTIALERQWADGDRDVRLRLDDGTFAPQSIVLDWLEQTYSPAPVGGDGSLTLIGDELREVLRLSNFSGSLFGDLMMHNLQPIADAFPRIANLSLKLPDGRLVSQTHALLAATVAPFYGEHSAQESVYTDLVSVLVAMEQVAGHGEPEALVYVRCAVSALLQAWEEDALQGSAVRQLAEFAEQSPWLESLLGPKAFDRLNAIVLYAAGS